MFKANSDQSFNTGLSRTLNFISAFLPLQVYEREAVFPDWNTGLFLQCWVRNKSGFLQTHFPAEFHAGHGQMHTGAGEGRAGAWRDHLLCLRPVWSQASPD